MAYGKPVKPRKGKKGVPQKPDPRYRKGKGPESVNIGSGGADSTRQRVIARKEEMARRWAQSTDDHQ